LIALLTDVVIAALFTGDDRRCSMGMLDKVTERLQRLMGKGTGKGTGKPGDGKGDEVKAAVKDAGEAVKDAAVHIKDVLKGD
jgi:hypothetical protein